MFELLLWLQIGKGVPDFKNIFTDWFQKNVLLAIPFFSFRNYDLVLQMPKGTTMQHCLIDPRNIINIPELTSGTISNHTKLCCMKVKVYKVFVGLLLFDCRKVT